MNQPAADEASAGWLQPSWGKLVFAALVAAAAFLLPQEIPLEWYPLNEPGTDINYLELTCASDVNGEIQIQYDLASDGHRPIDTIRWPTSPTVQTYTYTFPLPDAPIVEMRVGPPKDGALLIRQMRIVNRRNEEIRRFTRDLFRLQPGIAGIEPLPDGWKIVAAPGAANAFARIELFSPIIPVGKDHRNLLRCFLSTGYLAMMLTILLLAVLFVFHRLRNWRDLFAHVGFLACLAVFFSTVGNRGLIRNSIRYARYVPPVPSPGLKLEIDVASTFRTPAQLFWDTGAGMSESTSVRADYEPHDNLQTLRFALPTGPIRSLRLDPGDSAGAWSVRGLRLVDNGQRTCLTLPLSDIVPVREVDRLAVENDRLHLVTPGNARDPITGFKPAAVAAINQALSSQLRP